MNKYLTAFVLFMVSLFSTPKDDFDLLMGKNTKHWTYVAQSGDIEALTRYKHLYERQKALKDRKPLAKIPKSCSFHLAGAALFP